MEISGRFFRWISISAFSERITQWNGRGNISRAVEYQIDEKNKSAKLIWEYRNQKGNPFRDIQGSVQRLSNGHTLVGWGAPQEGAIQAQDRVPLFSEVDAAGTIIREMLSQGYNVSYRVYFEETK